MPCDGESYKQLLSQNYWRKKNIQMDMRNRVLLFLLNALFWLLLNGTTCYGVESDIQCLKSLKTQLKDPNDYLSSWVFDNETQGFICKFNGIECWHPDEDKILNIRLSNMALEGQFPLGLKNCTSMTGLDLSKNNLSGSLPENIDEIIPYVVTLDLSSNNFSGNLPSKICNLTYLNVLNLQHNQFSGLIPWQFGQLARLSTFNVADNSLSGKIPTFLSKNFPAENFVNNNDRLCGEPLTDCKEPAKKSHIGVVIGAAVGGIILAIIVIAVVFFFVLRSAPKEEEEQDVEANKWAKTIKRTQGIKFQVSMFEKLVPKMRLFNLLMATDNFSENNIIGLGRTGTVYKAILPDGSFLAVKRFQESHHWDKHFISEITALASTRHCNLVPLLGFCIARRERLLIYKYMPRGSLFDQLHQANYQPQVMDWATRMKIGIGVARGLMWLHHHCNPRIIHRKINSKCILLDEDYEPKISGFGSSRLMSSEHSRLTIPLGGNFKGSAYMAPELRQKLIATPKGDVYGFGIFMLELVSGQKPAQVAKAVQDVHNDTAKWIKYLINMYAKDESLIGRWCDGEINRVLKVVFACIASAPENRPTMLEAYLVLREIGARYGFIGEDEWLAPSDNINPASIPLNGLTVEQEIQEVH